MRQMLRSFMVAFLVLVGMAGAALADTKHTAYTADVLAQAEKSGDPYLLDFYAEWCSTCRAQDKVLGQLQSEDAKYLDVTIFRVDWDDPKSKPLIQKLKIPRRSTLVMFKGTTELGRVVAQTSKAKIRGLLELGL